MSHFPEAVHLICSKAEKLFNSNDYDIMEQFKIYGQTTALWFALSIKNHPTKGELYELQRIFKKVSNCKIKIVERENMNTYSIFAIWKNETKDEMRLSLFVGEQIHFRVHLHPENEKINGTINESMYETLRAIYMTKRHDMNYTSTKVIMDSDAANCLMIRSKVEKLFNSKEYNIEQQFKIYKTTAFWFALVINNQPMKDEIDAFKHIFENMPNFNSGIVERDDVCDIPKMYSIFATRKCGTKEIRFSLFVGEQNHYRVHQRSPACNYQMMYETTRAIYMHKRLFSLNYCME